MGMFSKYHRYREAGEAANVNNVARFGEPHHSLFTTSKVLTLHKHIDITDERERVVYESNTKFPSLHDKTDITDAEGKHIAVIGQKMLSLHDKYCIDIYRPEYEDKVVAILITLQHMIRDRENSAAASSSSSSSSST